MKEFFRGFLNCKCEKCKKLELTQMLLSPQEVYTDTL